MDLKLTDAEMKLARVVGLFAYASHAERDRSMVNAATTKATWLVLERWRRSLPSTESWEDSNPGVEYLNMGRDIEAAGIPRPEEVAG